MGLFFRPLPLAPMLPTHIPIPDKSIDAIDAHLATYAEDAATCAEDAVEMSLEPGALNFLLGRVREILPNGAVIIGVDPTWPKKKYEDQDSDYLKSVVKGPRSYTIPAK